MFSTISGISLVQRKGLTLISLSLLSELGEVDGVFTRVDHLWGERGWPGGRLVGHVYGD